MEEWADEACFARHSHGDYVCCVERMHPVFWGWATASGRVVELVEADGGQVIQAPVVSATVTLRSASDPDYGLNCLTDANGEWVTPARLKCDMYNVTVSKDGYSEVGPFSYPMSERSAHYTMEPIIMEKQK